MVHEVADQGVRDEAGGRHSALDDLRCGGLLHQALTAAARPLAVDVAVHEELRRDDVQALAHVLADARHGAAALRVRAVGVRRFVVMLFAPQVFGQRAAAGFGFAIVAGADRRRSRAPGLVELSLKTGLILDTGFFEEPPLLGAHGLGLGAELPGLQSR
jgi:chloramphenicol 3-O-phosphotransferase